MHSLRAELIWLVLASQWLLTGGLSLPCFLFTATLAARRRVHLHTRLTETPQRAFKSVWNYISAILWTTCKWKLSQCCWKCHLSPPCLPSCSLACRASQTHLCIHLTWTLFTRTRMQTGSSWMSLRAPWQLEWFLRREDNSFLNTIVFLFKDSEPAGNCTCRGIIKDEGFKGAFKWKVSAINFPV